MAEVFPEIIEGGFDENTEVKEFIANGSIPIWAAVVRVAAGSGEVLPRVGTTTTAGDPEVVGIMVGPNKTIVAGDVVYVAVAGRTKAIANAAIARGDPIETAATVNRIQTGTISAVSDLDDIFAEAETAAAQMVQFLFGLL